MSANEQIAGSCNLLIFSVGTHSFGVDTAQLLDMAAENDLSAARMVLLSKALDFKSAECRSPVGLSVKTGNRQPFHVVIDSMDEMLTLPVGDIKALPRLIEQHVLSKGIWGVVPRGGKIILLVDLERIYENWNNLHLMQPQAGEEGVDL